MSSSTKLPRRIAVIRLSAMGDVAMTAFVIRAVIEQYPSVAVTMVTAPHLAPFFENIEGVEVFGADFKREYIGKRGIYKLFKKLTSRNDIDAFFDLHDVIRTKILRVLFKLSFKKVYLFKKGREEKKWLCNEQNQNKKELKSTIARYAECFEQAGMPLKLGYKLEPNPLPLDDSIKKEIIEQKNGKWIGISPFAQHKGKIYPINLMEVVVEKLSENKEYTIFLFGGSKEERFITEQIAARYPNVISVTGKITLSSELRLMSNLDCMVSMDSSGSHMASLVGVKAITIWGATHPYAGFLAYGQSLDNVVSVDLPCRPCSVYGNKPCYKDSYECIYSIKPSDIVAKIEQNLDC